MLATSEAESKAILIHVDSLWTVHKLDADMQGKLHRMLAVALGVSAGAVKQRLSVYKVSYLFDLSNLLPTVKPPLLCGACVAFPSC